MHSLHYMLTTITLIAIICTHISFAQSQEPNITDNFAKNWVIDGKDKVVYSRTFNRHHEFSHTSCDTTNKYCNVTLTLTKSSNSESKTCKFTLDPFESTKLEVFSLFLPNDNNRKELVAVEWYRIGILNHLDSFLGFLNMTNCKKTVDHFIGSIEESAYPSHVIMYNYPNIRTSALVRKQRRLIKELSFEKISDVDSTESMKYIRVNHTFAGEEQPVELGSSLGFFFLATNDSIDSKYDVMYANLTTGETQILVSSNIDFAHTDVKTSGAYNKYGICWKTFDRGNRVNCTQIELDGIRSISDVSLELSDPIDWLAVHNLEESALLLVTGRCDEGKCDGFKVRKINADGRESGNFEIKNLDAELPERPLEVTMDVVEDSSKNEICFNFVSLNNKYEEKSAEKISATLQYRRNCVSKDSIAKMN